MSNRELRTVIENMEKERGINRDALVEMVQSALFSASKKSTGPAQNLEIQVDKETLAIKALADVEIVAKVKNRHTQITLFEARRTNPHAKIGDVIKVEVTPKNFGRIAAQTAKQAIIQKIREVEKEIVVQEYHDRQGSIVNGSITRIERGNIIVDLGRVEAIIPARERVQTEEYQIGDRIRAYILSVEEHISGYHIVLSRSHPDFVKRLFELEVSEIADGTVEIKGIAREAGYRTKIAVISHDKKVDPVGACVGMRGMRVKNIIRELLGEKIDIIRWNSDIKAYVTNSLSPAKLYQVNIDEDKAKITVIVDADQLSLAIGKRGQNARLTSKLTGWKIDIQKKKEDFTFEEKVALAIGNLSQIEGIEPEQAKKLVNAGFLTVDGILEASIKDLEENTGFDKETAQAIQDVASASKQPKEASSPKDSSEKSEKP